MADQQHETLNMLENFLDHPASEESESLDTQNTALVCPFEIKWAAIEKLVNELEEKFVRMPGPNLVQTTLRRLTNGYAELPRGTLGHARRSQSCCCASAR